MSTERKKKYNREYMRRYRFSNPEYIEKKKISDKKYKGRYPRTGENGRIYREKYKDRIKARQVLNNYLRDKKVDRGICEICSSPKTQAHHEDYSKPLEVHWLCLKHHAEHHKKFKTVEDLSH